jgi:glutamyl-tRNA reductase
MADKQKSYNIKVPVYTTEIIESKNDLFGITYAEIITAIKSKIEDPNKDSGEITKISKNVVNKILNIPIQNITRTDKFRFHR